MDRSWAQPVSVGVVSAVIGVTSSFAVVLAGLTAAGADPAQAASGLVVLTALMGVATIWLSRRFRRPLMVAWSTPGAALLASTGAVAGGWAAVVGDHGRGIENVAEHVNIAAQPRVSSKSKRHAAAADDVLITLPRAMLWVVQLAKAGEIDAVVLNVVDVVVMELQAVDVSRVNTVVGIGKLAIRNLPQMIVRKIVDGEFVAGGRDQ